MARRDKQIDRIEPKLERRPGIFKDRASSRVNVVTTSSARIGPAIFHLVERRFLAAFPAYVAHPETHIHDVIKAGLIIGEAFEEVPYGKFWCFALAGHASIKALFHTYVKGIIPYDTTDVLGVGEELPFKDESFDAVISVAVLEHVQDPFRCAKEICRVLKPGGELYYSVPFLQPYHGYPHHYFNATWQGLARLFDENLDIVDNFVPPALHPRYALSWFLNSWMEGLPNDVALRFSNLSIGDVIQYEDSDIFEEYCRHLSKDKVRELACGNSIIAIKSKNRQ